LEIIALAMAAFAVMLFGEQQETGVNIRCGNVRSSTLDRLGHVEDECMKIAVGLVGSLQKFVEN
jgi:hypothetical protein